MSLLSREIELFDFSIGIHHWRYTDADREAIVEGHRYAPAAFGRGRITHSGEEGKNALEITVPPTLPLLDLFRPQPPGLRVRLDLKRVRVRDGRIHLGWTGHVTDLDETHTRATLRCHALSAAVDTLGLRRSWQSSCPLVHYSQGPGLCNVDPDAYSVPAIIASIDSDALEAAAFAAFPDGYFEGGALRWPSPYGLERRFILAHTGSRLRLLTPAVLMPGIAVTALPGCDRTLGPGGCARFDNTLNYGGQPTLKGLRTPFGSDPLF